MERWLTEGGPVMWPLLGCSLLSLTVTVERLLWLLLERRRRDPRVARRMVELSSRGRFDDAAALGAEARDASARVLLAGLRRREHGLREAMQLAAQGRIAQMKRGLNVLDTIITLAPLLGILGTVLGIIESFDLLGSAGIRQPQEVVGGIAEALITTAAGLTVAVLALVPYNGLVAVVRRETESLEASATELEIAARAGAAQRKEAPDAAGERV